MISSKSQLRLLNRDYLPPSLQIMVTLNSTLNGTQRLGLVNGILNNSLTYNDSYSLVMVQMIINTATALLG